MSYFIVIRGPLGVGKTTLSERLAKEVGAEHILIDSILEQQGLEEDWEEGYISQQSFLRANKFAAERARRFLDQGTPVIFDGNFYWKSQIEDLVGQVDHRHYVFTLKAPLSVCIERDRGRDNPHGSGAASEVYAKSTEFDYGIGIDANRPIEAMIQEIRSKVSEDRA